MIGAPSFGSKILGAPIGASKGRGGGNTTGGRVASGRVIVMDGGFFFTATAVAAAAAATLPFAERFALPSFGFARVSFVCALRFAAVFLLVCASDLTEGFRAKIFFTRPTTLFVAVLVLEFVFFAAIAIYHLNLKGTNMAPEPTCFHASRTIGL